MSEYLIEKGSCPICGAVVELKIHRDCPPLNVQTWRTMVHCNRCFDYRNRLNKLQEGIEKVARLIFCAAPAKKDQVIEQLGPNLCKLSQALVEHVGRFHKQTPPAKAAEELVNSLFNHPDSARAFVNDYVNSVEDGARQLLVGESNEPF